MYEEELEKILFFSFFIIIDSKKYIHLAFTTKVKDLCSNNDEYYMYPFVR